MPRPKKKRDYRKIVVDDRAFQWRFNYGKQEGLLEVLADRDSSRRGQRLIVEWAWIDWFNEENRVETTCEPRVVSPGFVAAAIRNALKLGWRPSTDAKGFVVSYTHGEFTFSRN